MYIFEQTQVQLVGFTYIEYMTKDTWRYLAICRCDVWLEHILASDVEYSCPTWI